MLVEFGHVCVTLADGREFSFTPSFRRIASLGDAEAIVSLYIALHGPDAYREAPYILSCLCDQEDPTPAVGWHEMGEDGPVWRDGAINRGDQVILARHLMRHGIVGKSKPDQQGTGKYSARFDVAEYVSAARVHLGLSAAEAESMSMTEFQCLLEMKYPQAKEEEKEVPSREEYEAFMSRIKERKHG